MARQISLKLRILAIPVLIVLIALIEAYVPIRHLLSNFRLITFILVFLLICDAASLRRGASRDFLIVLASIAFGLCVVEAVAIRSEPQQSLVTTEGWSVYRPEIGWGPGHAGRFHSEKTDTSTGATIFNVDYTINANLLRDVRGAKSDSPVVFFGDSFTFGTGVNDSDTLPQQFADLLGPDQSVLNLGFNGYSPQQFLREEETGLFDQVIGAHPKLFVFMTAAWHAERTSCNASWTANAPRYDLAGSAVAYRGPCLSGARLWLREWLGNSAAYRVFASPIFSRVKHDDIELYIRVLLEAVRLANVKYGVPTLIPYLPVSESYFAGTGFTNQALIDRFRAGGAYVLDAALTDEATRGLPLNIQGDGHPTPLANRLRAALLKSYIDENLPGVLVSR
ncbi:SGNH/GDSL hydrolase family protein [Methylocapsa palsarum]|uniref:SGNH/GDSL hydrolase family protein n=1 Tax=Methylocapsa palsarum TaxID=1612308 RepID=UPI001FCD884B|nr:SGNH/GDSL hydrolase family protein [Methylocapsa palsarum]